MLKKQNFIFFLILLLAAILRFTGSNWDSNHHLHPDERFLTMVNNDSHWPTSLANYLNPTTSTLNPYNNKFDFFVYGNLPLVINKGLAIIFNNNNYHQLTLQGRLLSVICDLITIYLIFLISQILTKKLSWPNSTKYWASLSYALLVLAIQLSHFFTTDLFLNVFGLASIYFALKYSNRSRISNIIASGFCLACALASKITAVFYAPLIAVILLLAIWQNSDQPNLKIITKLKQTALIAVVFFASAYLSLRLADPYYFAYQSWLDYTPNPLFVANLKTLNAYSNAEAWFPPAVQWIPTTKITFALNNLIIYGWGIVLSIFIFLGIFANLKEVKIGLIKNKKLTVAQQILLSLLFWTISIFIYQSSQFSKTLRYFIIICPFLTIFAGYSLSKIWLQLKARWLKLTLVLTLLIWPLLFIGIYLYPHSRVTASEWIFANLPDKSKIATELWDDALPLNVSNNKHFEIIQLGVFDQDNEEKLARLKKQLSEVDYYILSSNRAWGSMSKVPERYPLMSKFYQDLFAQKLKFKKIAQFEVFPNLRYLGIPLSFNDSHAEEAFTVYDHPQVMIFERIKD